jgi:hypothetical protein
LRRRAKWGTAQCGLYAGTSRVFPERAPPPTFGSSCNYAIYEYTPTTAFRPVIKGIFKLGSISIGSAIIALRIYWKAYSCSCFHWNVVSFLVSLYRGFAILLKFLINILIKLANPINPLTSIVFIGISYVLIASSFLGSILTHSREIS